MEDVADVVVVGAGFAGLIAAWDLGQRVTSSAFRRLDWAGASSGEKSGRVRVPPIAPGEQLLAYIETERRLHAGSVNEVRSAGGHEIVDRVQIRR